MSTVGDAADWLVKRISALVRTADSTDLTDGEYMAVDKSDGYTRKMTVGNLATWVLGRIKNLSTTITAFRTGDVIPVDGPDGSAKMSKDDLLRETAFDTIENGVDLFDVKEIRTHIADSNLVLKQVYVEEGKTYKVTFPNGIWNYSDVGSTYLAFKLIGHTSQEVYAEVRGTETIQSEYEFVSVASERLRIAYRGNVGQDVAIDIQRETECKKDIAELFSVDSEDALGLEVDITNKFNFSINAQIIAEYFDGGDPTSSLNFGKTIASAGAYLCCDYLDISRFEKLDIVLPVRKAVPGAYTGLCFYDNSKNPIYGFYRLDDTLEDVTDGYSKLYSVDVPKNARYIRTTIFGSSGATGTMTVQFSCKGTAKSSKRVYDLSTETNYEDFTAEFLFKNTYQIIAGGKYIGYTNYSPTGALICSDYIDVEKYVKLKIVMPIRKYASDRYTGLCFYDSSKNVINGYYFTDGDLATDADGYSALKEIEVPDNAKYIRTTIFGRGTSQGKMTVPFSCEGLVKSTSFVLFKARKEMFKRNLFPNFSAISCPYYPNHDATYCKTTDKIYAFNKPDDQPNGELKVYDRNFQKLNGIVSVKFYETYKDGSHPALEMKSVDCNQVNNYLLVGNGHIGYTAVDSYVYVFYDWLDWENAESEVNFSTCGEYIRFDFSELGEAIYAWWASNNPINDTILVDVGRLNNFFLVQLGKGTNQLEKGTYTATTSDKYNGTWRVLREWHTDSYFERAQHGGQFYKGSLYVASNEDYQNDYFKIDLKDDGRVEFSKMACDCYDQNNKLAYQYPDGMFIIDGYMYASPLRYGDVYHSDSNKVVLKIEISE